MIIIINLSHYLIYHLYIIVLTHAVCEDQNC